MSHFVANEGLGKLGYMLMWAKGLSKIKDIYEHTHTLVGGRTHLNKVGFDVEFGKPQ